MNARYFLDTNVIVYAHDADNPKRRAIAQDLIISGIRDEAAVISTQVLSEFFVTITRKVQNPFSSEQARAEIKLLRIMQVVEIEFGMILQAIQIHIDNQISYWDALIISAASRAHCQKIYTEDLNPGQLISGVEIINPFLA